MKTTIGLFSALAVTLVTTGTASAHGHKMHVPMYPIPFAPVAPGVFPVGGSGFSMNVAMSGDASALIMLPLLARLARGVLGLAEATPQGMTAAEARAILKEFLDTLEKRLKGTEKSGSSTSSGSSSSPTRSRELEKSQGEVQRLLAEIEGKRGPSAPVRAAKSSDPRAEVQRLLAEIESKASGVKSSSAATAVSVSKK
jgi:hypothetical protein